MTTRNKKLTVAVFARTLRENFLRMLNLQKNVRGNASLDVEDVTRVFDDCLRFALLEELDKRDANDNK